MGSTMNKQAIDWSVLQETIEHLTSTEKLQLIEEVARSLRAPATASKPGDRRATLGRLRRELAALPLGNPADGFSNRDHDDELYGGPS